MMNRPNASGNVEQQTDQLVRLYFAYVVRLIQSIVHDPQEAEDLAQETFIAALLNIDKENERINYRAWLSKIAVNKARDYLRRQKVRQRFLLGWIWERQTSGRMPEDMATQQETTQKLWRAVETLSEKQRLPIILRYGHGLSIREISEILDIKEGTVHSRLHNGQKQLARLLNLDVENVLVLQGGVS